MYLAMLPMPVYGLGSASLANVPLVPPCIDLLLTTIVADKVVIPELLM
jgi:hypothetical protein